MPNNPTLTYNGCYTQDVQGVDMSNLKFLTQLGQQNKGRDVNRTPKSAIHFINDILLRAATDKLDVIMLCGSLRKKHRDEQFKAATGHTFADAVREVLKANRNVSIVVWDELRDETTPYSPATAELMKEARSNKNWGTLDIRFSGTRAGEDQINHFLLAKSRPGENDRWILRIEKPHVRPSPEETDNEVPAAILFDTNEARELGEPMSQVFEQVVQAIDSTGLISDLIVQSDGVIKRIDRMQDQEVRREASR